MARRWSRGVPTTSLRLRARHSAIPCILNCDNPDAHRPPLIESGRASSACRWSHASDELAGAEQVARRVRGPRRRDGARRAARFGRSSKPAVVPKRAGIARPPDIERGLRHAESAQRGELRREWSPGRADHRLLGSSSTRRTGCAAARRRAGLGGAGPVAIHFAHVDLAIPRAVDFGNAEAVGELPQAETKRRLLAARPKAVRRLASFASRAPPPPTHDRSRDHPPPSTIAQRDARGRGKAEHSERPTGRVATEASRWNYARRTRGPGGYHAAGERLPERGAAVRRRRPRAHVERLRRRPQHTRRRHRTRRHLARDGCIDSHRRGRRAGRDGRPLRVRSARPTTPPSAPTPTPPAAMAATRRRRASRAHRQRSASITK